MFTSRDKTVLPLSAYITSSMLEQNKQKHPNDFKEHGAEDWVRWPYRPFPISLFYSSMVRLVQCYFLHAIKTGQRRLMQDIKHSKLSLIIEKTSNPEAS